VLAIKGSKRVERSNAPAQNRKGTRDYLQAEFAGQADFFQTPSHRFAKRIVVNAGVTSHVEWASL
jgi:hypothetical protein